MVFGTCLMLINAHIKDVKLHYDSTILCYTMSTMTVLCTILCYTTATMSLWSTMTSHTMLWLVNEVILKVLNGLKQYVHYILKIKIYPIFVMFIC